MDDFKLFLLNNKKIFIFIVCIMLILGIGVCVCVINDDIKKTNNDISFNIEKIEEVYTENEMIVIEEVEVIEFITVDIKGRVKKPGIYRIDKSLDRRISDVITMAGGLMNDADTSVTNLAKKLFDEMVIIIYSKADVKEFSEVLKKQETINNACQNECDSCITNDNLPPVKNDSSINETNNEESKKLININTANKEELMTLTGIGESKALAIIEYRKETPFEKIEDIMNITGIKESAFEKIKDYITV